MINSEQVDNAIVEAFSTLTGALNPEARAAYAENHAGESFEVEYGSFVHHLSDTIVNLFNIYMTLKVTENAGRSLARAISDGGAEEKEVDIAKFLTMTGGGE